jgi:hypothetical protein
MRTTPATNAASHPRAFAWAVRVKVPDTPQDVDPLECGLGDRFSARV